MFEIHRRAKTGLLGFLACHGGLVGIYHLTKKVQPEASLQTQLNLAILSLTELCKVLNIFSSREKSNL